MTVKILLKAQDPGSCARFLGALGVRLAPTGEEGDGRRRARLTVELELDGAPGARPFESRLLTSDALAAARRVVEIGGGVDFAGAADFESLVRVTGPNGETVTLQEVVDAPETSHERPLMDVAMFAHVSWWLDANLAGLRDAVERAGGANLRVVGPVALGGRPGQDFTLLVDGGPDTDLAAIDAFIASVRDGAIGLRAQLASNLSADRREAVEAIAFRR